jgi:hypothetical protein
MRTQRQSRGAAGGGRTAKLIVLWLVIAAVVGGFGASAFTLLNRPPDAVALCEQGSHIAASTIVLVDTTDALTEIHRRRVRAAIEAERDALPRGGKLSVVTMNEADPSQPVEIVSACNPGKSGDANPLFVTVSQVDKHWAAAFGEPVEAAIARASEAPAAGSSPLIATAAALLTRPDFDARVPQRRLVVVSDMLEHQKGGYSQLGGGDFWKGYANSSLSRLVALDLRGVAVAIDYLARPNYAGVQGAQHRRFWQRLFTEAGAVEVMFIGMPPAEAAPAPEPQDEVRLVKRKRRN